MKKLSLILAGLLLPFVAFAQVSNDNEDGVYSTSGVHRMDSRPGQVLVKFKENSNATAYANSKGFFATTRVSAVDKVLNKLGTKRMESLMPLTGSTVSAKSKSYSGKDVEDTDLSSLYLVEFEDSISVNEAVDALKELDDVEYAEPNYIVYLLDTDNAASSVYADEPLIGQQWGLDAINLPQLWHQDKITTKRPVIAILDTGVDITHPDLAANIWTNTSEQNGEEDADDDANGFKDDIHGWDFINNTPKIRDNNGHGTHCAGIAAAVGGNGIGVVGANPDALIMPVTIMQSDGTGDVATLIKGIDYAAANGADVLSMSFGGYSHSMAEEQALAHAYSTAVLVAAVGNDGQDIREHPMFPAAYTFVFGVQATQNNGFVAYFSNVDPDGPFYSSYNEDKLYNYEIKAPGVNIISTFPNGKYKELNGTSMACPIVAGAISRLMQCKELGNKEELLGDLINSTTSIGNLDICKAYQMSDVDRRPTLNLITYNIDDAAGDGDGRPDAGETIDIYPVLRNQWGAAKNIYVSIELAENEDSEIVQIINGTADFVYNLDSYGKATSANPLRIKINDNCIDSRHICLIIKATCDNITKDVKQDVVLVAENGIEIGGMIYEDTTLPEGTYIVTKPLAVPVGVTLTIEPGAVLKFRDGTGLSVVYTSKNEYMSQYGGVVSQIDRVNSGKLVMNGTPEKRIVLTNDNHSDGRWTFNVKENSPSHIYSIKYNQFDIDDLEHDTYSYVDISKHVLLYGGYFINSNFYGETIAVDANYASSFEKCNLANCEILAFSTTGVIQNKSNFANINRFDPVLTASWGAENTRSCNITPMYNVWEEKYITLYSNSSTPIVYKTDYPNYLGSSKETVARKYVQDIQCGFGYGYFDISNMLTRPNAEAHGIVWKVVVNGKDAQDEFEELAPLGVGKHKFEVYFNRPMNKDVVPTISMGARPPYSSISIAEDGENFGWNEAGDVYTAYLTITGKTKTDGLNRIHVYGAEDDEFFEIPEEKLRFNVYVQATGSMATGLMAEPGLGKVNLNWETRETDFDDLLGFNVYRYSEREETYKEWGYNDEGKYGNWEKTRTVCDTVIVNGMLVEPGEIEDGVMSQSFTDYDVVPGTTYYYYVKEMSTDLSSYEVSKVVAATPLTAQKGDANGSMSVDVADVVTEIAYLTDQNPQPFIFEAADVNEDNEVDIIDVVGTINIITAPEVGTSSISDGTAKYTIENGILYVEAEEPLGGMQISINAPKGTEFEVLDGLNGMEATTTWKSSGEFMLLSYSMSGNCIPTGKNAILRIGDNSVKNVVLSSTRGQNIVALNGDLTAVGAVSGEAQIALPYPSPFTDELHIPYSISKAGQSEVRLMITDLAGRTVNTYAATKAYGDYEYVWNPSANVTKGVYMVTLYVDGKQMQSSKVIKL